MFPQRVAGGCSGLVLTRGFKHRAWPVTPFSSAAVRVHVGEGGSTISLQPQCTLPVTAAAYTGDYRRLILLPSVVEAGLF